MGTDCTTDGLHITYLQDKAKALLSWLESEEVSNPKHPDHEIRVYRVWDLARDIEKDSREYRESLDESPPTPRGDTQSPRTPSQEKNNGTEIRAIRHRYKRKDLGY